jgi:lysozyme
MKVSKRGLAEIASHEGIVNYPYFDSVGVRTVGIGHTVNAGPPDPSKNLREFSVSEIMDIFARDVGKFEKRVNAAFKRPLTQEQFDAAVSFDFNTGGIHRASWVDHFNAGNMAAAKKAFMNWSKPSEIIPRRKKERDLFFDGKYSSNGYANLYPATAAGRVLWNRGKRVNVLELMGARPIVPKPSPQGKPAGKGILAAILSFLLGWLRKK